VANDIKFVTTIQNALKKENISVDTAAANRIADSISAEYKSVRSITLPEVVYAEVDTEKIVSSIVTTYEGIMNVTLFPADPVRLFLSALAAVIAQQNAVADWSVKQNFIRFASGVYLDHLCEFL
jgi:hypothetical protein